MNVMVVIRANSVVCFGIKQPGGGGEESTLLNF